MTSLDAKALKDDVEGLAFLRDVLKTGPVDQPLPKTAKPFGPAPVRVPRMAAKATRRAGLIGATALAALVVAIAPAKPATPDPTRAVEVVAQSAQPSGATIATGLSEAGACPRVRRKLWVEGEGWVVRTVARC